jgi:anti-sigma regulatory factor (Ser/Thr protein kinase)
VADELVTNVIRHGCRDDRPHTIDVSVAVREDGLTLRISDDGIPFDPFAAPALGLNRPIEARPAAGLGIPLVRRLSAECCYARVDGQNQVTVILKQPAPWPSAKRTLGRHASAGVHWLPWASGDST